MGEVECLSLSSPEKYGPRKPEALWVGVEKSEGKHNSPSTLLSASVLVTLKLTPALGLALALSALEARRGAM